MCNMNINISGSVMFRLIKSSGRSGLGKDLEEERKRKKRLELYALKAKRRKETEKDLRVDFKSRMRSKLNERQIFADLSKSQKACEQLDSQKVG